MGSGPSKEKRKEELENFWKIFNETKDRMENELSMENELKRDPGQLSDFF
jgi:hypothetical protein